MRTILRRKNLSPGASPLTESFIFTDLFGKNYLMKNMNRLVRLTIVFALLIFPLAAFAQGGGIKGTLKDEKGNEVVNAYVEVSTGGIIKGREVTDIDGAFNVHPLDGGNYTVKFSYQGHQQIVNDVILADGQIALVNTTIQTSKVLTGVVVRATTYRAPIINPEHPGGSSTKTAEQIDKAPTRNTADLASLSTQVHQSSSGGGLSIAGGRTSNTKYVIDGQQLPPGSNTFTNQNPGNVEAITTYVSGVPARYGDASGGLITITTRGATARTQGNIQFEHSVEGYNNNELTVNLSGPLYRKRDSSGKKGRPVIGYNITADGIYSDDYNPLYGDSYVINADRLYQLQQHPLLLVQEQGVSKPQYATQFVQASDIETQKRRPNAKYLRGNVGGKLDFNLTENINVRLGANYFNSNTPGYDRAYSLYSSDQFQRTNSQTGRGFLRFTQRFGNRTSREDINKDNVITNASYTAQIDYQKDYSTTQDQDKKHNTFDYGYVGKFEELYTPTFTAGAIDPLTGKAGIVLNGYQPTGVLFTPGTQNPLLANYTKDFYTYNSNPLQQQNISAGLGLRNGDVATLTRPYNLFTNIGTANRNGWVQNNSDQVGVQVDASFDIKRGRLTHSVEFGLFYQQQNQRAYSVSGAGIWSLICSGIASL